MAMAVLCALLTVQLSAGPALALIGLGGRRRPRGACVMNVVLAVLAVGLGASFRLVPMVSGRQVPAPLARGRAGPAWPSSPG